MSPYAVRKQTSNIQLCSECGEWRPVAAGLQSVQLVLVVVEPLIVVHIRRKIRVGSQDIRTAKV